jgi:hypothetical protein
MNQNHINYEVAQEMIRILVSDLRSATLDNAYPIEERALELCAQAHANLYYHEAKKKGHAKVCFGDSFFITQIPLADLSTLEVFYATGDDGVYKCSKEELIGVN